jgi:dipeptidase D
MLIKTGESHHLSRVYEHFMEITKRSHPSGKENPIREYVVECANSIENADITFYKHNATDPGERVIVIRRKGSNEYANASYVTLQAHLDMVCFPNENIYPLEVFEYTDEHGEQWIKAGKNPESIYNSSTGTTLGADDGIGVATALAIIEDHALKDYPIECLFTVQEETNMGGVAGLDRNILSGTKYINLDAEDMTTIIYGSASGCNVQYDGTIKRTAMPDKFTSLIASISGLQGGHSGVDINKGRLNAIKILIQALIKCNNRLTNLDNKDTNCCDFRIITIRRNEEEKMNSIPSSASAIIALSSDNKDKFESNFGSHCQSLKMEYKAQEDGFDSEVVQQNTTERPLNETSTDSLLLLLNQIPHGVIKMIPDNPSLVETSTNLAGINMTDSKVTIKASNRSSNDKSFNSLKKIQKAMGNCMNYRVKFYGEYPSWQPNKDSEMLAIAKEVYKRIYGSDNYMVSVIHAGLECSYVVQKYDNAIDCISIGPTILDPHSGSERLQTSSVKTFYLTVAELIRYVFLNE